MTWFVTCHNAEGWNAVSRIRVFDSTPCFEEGIVLAALLGSLLVLSLVRVLTTCSQPQLNRNRNSRWLLWAKLVRYLFEFNSAKFNLRLKGFPWNINYR